MEMKTGTSLIVDRMVDMESSLTALIVQSTCDLSKNQYMEQLRGMRHTLKVYAKASIDVDNRKKCLNMFFSNYFQFTTER